MLWPSISQHLNQSDTIEGYQQPITASHATDIAASSRVTTSHFTR